MLKAAAMWLVVCAALLFASQLIPHRAKSFWHGTGLVPPPPAAALGYGRRTFHDPFTSLSTIDTSNTLAGGFNWYIKTAWPNASDSNTNPLTWRLGTVTNSALLSVGAGGLTISNYTGTGFYSVATGAYNSGSFVGTSFPGGAYFEVKWTVNLACNNNGTILWPIIWMVDKGFVMGTANRYTEIDFVENFPTANLNPTNDGNTHDWTFAGGAVTAHNQANVNWSRDSATHIYGLAWNLAANHGGIGQLLHYDNGVLQTGMTITYSAGSGSSPAATPSNPNGTFLNLDASSPFIMMSAGANSCAQTIGYVDVWQQ